MEQKPVRLGVAVFVRRQLPAITLTSLLGSAAATQSLTRQVNAAERLGFGVERACGDAITRLAARHLLV